MLRFKAYFTEAHIVYNELAPSGKFDPKVPISQWDPHKHLRTHVDNLHYLKFIANHPNTSVNEKIQAAKEMQIADRKIKFWTNHPKYDHTQGQKIHDEVKKKWSTK
jgi:hypothetical protein